MSKKQFIKPVTIMATSELEATTISTYLNTLSRNLDMEVLGILAAKSSKPGIGQKVKNLQNLI